VAPQAASIWSPVRLGEKFIGKDDEILITAMEHHSNIVPWQMLCERKGAKLQVIPMSDEGEIDLKDCGKRLLTSKTKLVSVVHISNSLGTVNPVREIIRLAHANGTPVLIDGAQAMHHMPLDVQERWTAISMPSLPTRCMARQVLEFSTERKNYLNAMPPYQGGGDMIKTVTFAKDGIQRTALQVRSRYTPHRRRNRTWSGHRLHQQHRIRGHHPHMRRN
jgi:cysteine desulfurase/selenocysteine lyase